MNLTSILVGMYTKNTKNTFKMKLKPIETAPKDGTPVLLLTENGMIEGYWYQDQWAQDVIHSTNGGCRNVAFWVQPTHWTPLPETSEED